MWPHTWHLKHQRGFGSHLLALHSLLVPVPWLLWLLLTVPWPPVPCPVGMLWAGVICPGPLLPLWEFGWLGVLLPFWSLPWPLSQGLLGSLEGLLPCPALVREAMSLAICCANSAIPSPKSVATVAVVLTLSQISSFSLSALWAVTISCE